MSASVDLQWCKIKHGALRGVQFTNHSAWALYRFLIVGFFRRGLSDEPDLFERGEFSLVCVVEVAWLNYFRSMDDTVATFFTERNFPCKHSSDGRRLRICWNLILRQLRP